MFVKNRMSPNPIWVSPEASIFEALDIMKQKKIRRLPVVDRGKLAGIVTQLDLLKVSPSPATSLSVFEINYLIARMKVGEVMAREVVTVTPDTIIEEAALLMRDNRIGGLPVVDGDGRVVGIITETDIFDIFIDMLGLRRAGARLTLQVEDRPGVLADITRIIKELDVSIASLVTFPRREGLADLVIRLYIKDAGPVAEALTRNGYQVIHVA